MTRRVGKTGRPIPPNAGKGRKRGVPNKTTASIKAAFLEAFAKRGGVPALLEWSKAEPTEFYKLCGRLIPAEITGKDGGPVEHLHRGEITWGSEKIPL